MTLPLDITHRLCIHTITTRPWSIEEAVENYSACGVNGITVWRESLEGKKIVEMGQRIREAGLSVVSLCRGGFFPAVDVKLRQSAIDDNLRAIDEAASLGAPLLVLVCGADPGQPLEVSRRQIVEGIQAIIPHATACGVKLGIEPLHPMYADTRSAINTLAQANDICEELGSASVGVVVDLYHLWWDPHLEAEIHRCGCLNKLFAFHVCDWRVPTQDLLYDRALMGEGCIPIRKMRGWVEAAGFDGFIEVEIFSNKYWAGEQGSFLYDIIWAYKAHV